MLVGEVRAATVGVGSSWKLSGGSQFSSAVTKVSKKCQVLRAVRRRNCSCTSLNSGGDTSIGRLIGQASHGAANQATSRGRAKGRWAGCITLMAAPLVRATAG